jgi:hypothetical protein
MTKKSVFGIITNEGQAAEVVEQLKTAGFTSNDISALFSDRTGTKDFAHEQHTKAPEGTVAGGGAGALIGFLLGWLAGMGILALPGLRALADAGPVLAGLSGAAVGVAMGAGIGALIGTRFPEFVARRYEGKIQEGNILISVHCDSASEVRASRNIFNRRGVRDIATGKESAVRELPWAGVPHAS